MTETEASSPLAFSGVSGAPARLGGSSVSVRELPFIGHLMLRFKGGADAIDADALKAIETTLGMALPRSGARFADGPVTALRLSTRRWLFVTEPEAQAMWMCRLSPELPASAALFDVSEGFDTLVLEGPRARELLATGCPIDLHDECFPIGAAASTRLAQASIVLRRTGALCYHAHVDAADANYLWAWLQASIDEFTDEEERA